MDMYAARPRAPRSRAVSASPTGVHLYIQFGSQDIRRYAESEGLPRGLRSAPAPSSSTRRAARASRRVPASSDSPDQVTVSAHQPKLPRPQRPRQGLPREPARRRGERDRGTHRRSVLTLARTRDRKAGRREGEQVQVPDLGHFRILVTALGTSGSGTWISSRLPAFLFSRSLSFAAGRPRCSAAAPRAGRSPARTSRRGR